MAELDYGLDEEITGLLPKKRRRSSVAPGLDDEQENSLLSDIGHATLSGVSAVGNFLDIPGSMVRDTLTGNNPFDQILSPFTDKNRVSGRDFNRKLGLAGNKDTWGNWFGGLATEILLDPTTYLGVGALTKAGKIAQAGGVLGDVSRVAAKGVGKNVGRMSHTLGDLLSVGDTAAQAARRADLASVAAKQGLNLADILDEPLQRGVANFGLPGLNVDLGTGMVGKKVAGALDRIGSVVKGSYPGRVASAMFDPAVGGNIDPVAQDLARQAYAGKIDAEKVARHKHLDAMDAMDKSYEAFKSAYGDDVQAWVSGNGRLVGAGKSGGFAGDMDHLSKTAQAMTANWHDRITRLAAETGDVDKAFKQFKLDPAKLSSEVRQQIADAGKEMIDSAAKLREARIEMGATGGWLGDLPGGGNLPGAGASPIQHVARYAKEWRDWSDVTSTKQFAAKVGSDIGREETTRHLPAEIANQLLMDPLARAHPNHDPIQHIMQTYGDWLGHGNKEMLDPQTGAKYAVNQWAPGAPHGSGQAKMNHAAALSKYAEEHAQRAMYTNSMVKDYSKHMSDGFRSQATLNAIHEMIAKELGNGNIIGTQGTGIKLSAAYTASGLNPSKSLDYMADLMARRNPGLNKQGARQLLENAEIPEDMMRAMMSMKKLNTDPEWLGVLGKHVDAFNNWFKSWVYLPFPSSAVRNLNSGYFVNATTGYVNGAKDMSGLSRQTKAAATALKAGDKDLAREFFINGVIDPYHTQDITHGADVYHGLLPGNPFNVKETYGQAKAKKSLENTQRNKPATLSAAQKASAAAQTALDTGAKANASVEWINRGGMYLYLTREKGWTAKAAAEKVKELHFDYGSSGRTQFERQVAGRLVPFYRFQRGMAPLFLKTLAKHPGGAMAQTVRAERLTQGNDPTTPDYIAGTLAVPNPFGANKQDGSKNYITGFGLPFEQTLGFAEGFPNPRAGIREALAQTSPLVKAPIEFATGQSLFQTGPGGGGRAMEDLDPTIGRTLANVGHMAGLNGPSGRPVEIGRGLEFLASNSPASRGLTTARMLTDPRKSLLEKGINFGTGIRSSDVSPAAQDAVLRQRLAEQMKKAGAATFEKIYFRDMDEAEMSPEEQQRAKRMEAMMTELAKRAKARRKK